ncbi:hypothetical protein RLIN73S_07098 [Rhodanobacter lindaniclasticus]
MPPEWTARMDTLQDAKQTDSGETRIQSWKFAANVAIHRPLTGGGFDDYLSEPLWSAYAPEGSIQRAIHSIYFRTLGEHGFVGLLLFLGFRCREPATVPRCASEPVATQNRAGHLISHPCCR